MTNRILTPLLILLMPVVLYGQENNPFISLSFDKVVLYDYASPPGDPELFDKNGKISPSAIVRKTVELDKVTINSLSLKLGNKQSYGQVKAICFLPHLGIAYFKKEKLIRHVLVCLECNGLQADIDIPAQHQGKQGKGEKAYYLKDGMSKSFRKYLNELLIRYNFSHQVKKGSGFDD